MPRSMRPTRARPPPPCYSPPTRSPPRPSRPADPVERPVIPFPFLTSRVRCAVPDDPADGLARLDEAAARQASEERAGRALAAARARLVLGRDAKSAFFACLALRL